MKLPIYDISINLDDTDTGMCCCSLVEDAAVSVDFLAFNKETEDKQHQLLQFKNDGLEHKIFGVAIRCNYPIYRIDNFGREFYVRFNKEVIEQIVLKYSKEGLHNLVSLNHDGNLVSGITLVEMFIKNSDKGISPVGFEDIEDGSLFVTYKVEDDNIWNEIINKNVKGFSIEIISDIVPTNETIEDGFSTQEPEEDDINSFINDLYEYLVGEGINDVEILFADSKKKLNEIIENAIDNETKVNIGLKGESKVLQGFIYTTNENILSLYDERKDTWHVIQKNTIKSINTVNTNIVVNWNKAFANPDFQKILDIVRENPNPQPKATVHEDIILEAINSKDVMMITYFDESGENCTTYRQGYILTKIRNRKGNECIRYFETNGATHSSENQPLPSWRTLRLDRIGQIKKAPNIFKPLVYPPDGWNPTMSVERDGSIVLAKSVF